MPPTPLALAALLAAAPPVPLVENGISAHAIVHAADAGPVERYAARELHDHLALATGAKLPVVAAAPAGRAVFVGYGPEAARRFPGFDPAAAGPDGFARRTTPAGDVLLAGSAPRGTLYAAYDLLEECAGVHWLAPDATHVPKLKDVRVPAAGVVRRPAFACRDVHVLSAFDGTWAARNRVNGHASRLTPEQGGTFPWAYPPVHTFAWLVPHQEFWPKQGDLYMLAPEPGRGRVPVSLCLTNPRTHAAVTDRVRRWMKEQPDKVVFSVSQNDWRYRCVCPDCLKSEARHGAPSGPILELVNAVADGVAKEFPGRLVETLAYDYSAAAPKDLRPRDNVLIRLCMMGDRGSCDAWLAGWKGKAKHLHVWDYVTGFTHFHVPFPNLYSFGPHLRQYRAAGASGVLVQGNYKSPGGTFNELQAYLLAKLCWDPDADAEKLIDEFVTLYYGPAAGPMRRYLDLLHADVKGLWGPDPAAAVAALAKKDTDKRWEAALTGWWLGPYHTAYLNPAAFARYDVCFSEAERAAAGRPDVLKRVQLAKLQVLTVKLGVLPPKDPARGPLLDEYVAICRAHGVAWFGEFKTVEQFRLEQEPLR